jgi:hypothetical protein
MVRGQLMGLASVDPLNRVDGNVHGIFNSIDRCGVQRARVDILFASFVFHFAFRGVKDWI